MNPVPCLLALLAVAGLFGCMRSAPLPTDAIDCRPGRGLVIDGSALCVYRPPDLPEECPEAVPNGTMRGDVLVCTLQVRPARVLIESAIELTDDAVWLQLADGGPPP